MTRMITVVDVMRDMNVEFTRQLGWQAGNAVRDQWVKRYGSLPPKEMRNKTQQAGRHLVAVYPEAWRRIIEDVIRYYRGGSARQGRLL
jgi:hypothetical protein